MGATDLAGTFDVNQRSAFTTYGDAATDEMATVNAKRQFAAQYGHDTPQNLAEATALNDMVLAQKAFWAKAIDAIPPSIEHRVYQPSPTLTPGKAFVIPGAPGVQVTGGGAPAARGGLAVPPIALAGLAGGAAFLLWPRRWSASRPKPKRRRRSRAPARWGRRRRPAARRRRRNPRAGRGTTMLALLGVGAGVLWAARQLGRQVSAITPVDARMAAEEQWGTDARAPGLGCGPCLAGATTPGYYC